MVIELFWSLSIVKATLCYMCEKLPSTGNLELLSWTAPEGTSPIEDYCPWSWAWVVLLTCLCQWRETWVCSRCSSTSWLWKIGVLCSPHGLHISEHSFVDKHFPISLFHYLLPALTSDTFTFISLVLSEQQCRPAPGTMEEVICRGFNYSYIWEASRKNILQVTNFQLVPKLPHTCLWLFDDGQVQSGDAFWGVFQVNSLQHHSPGLLERVAQPGYCGQGVRRDEHFQFDAISILGTTVF